MRKYKFEWRYDRRSGNCNFSNCKLTPPPPTPPPNPPKKIGRTSTGFERLASAFVLQCSTNWAIKFNDIHLLQQGQSMYSCKNSPLPPKFSQKGNSTLIIILKIPRPNVHPIVQQMLQRGFQFFFSRPQFL